MQIFFKNLEKAAAATPFGRSRAQCAPLATSGATWFGFVFLSKIFWVCFSFENVLGLFFFRRCRFLSNFRGNVVFLAIYFLPSDHFNNFSEKTVVLGRQYKQGFKFFQKERHKRWEDIWPKFQLPVLIKSLTCFSRPPFTPSEENNRQGVDQKSTKKACF